MLDIPSPRQINPWLLDATFFWHSVLIVFLHHAFHGAEVAVPEHKCVNWPLPCSWMVCTKLKLSLLTQGQRQYPDVLELALEDALIVRMPTYRRLTILINIHIATVRPLGFSGTPKHGHDYLHELFHKRWEHLRLDLDASVAICAVAAVSHHPGRLSWYGAMWPLWLVPVCHLLDIVKEMLAHLLGERILHMGCKAASASIIHSILPSGTWAHGLRILANQPQANLFPRLLPLILGVFARSRGNIRIWTFFTLALAFGIWFGLSLRSATFET